MTTIAYKDGIVAYDSRCCAGPLITTDDYDKKTIIGDSLFFMSGDLGHQQRFMEDWPNPSAKHPVFGIRIHKGVVYRFISDEHGYWQLSLDYPWAEGSGADHAFTAMDLGCSAKEAVKMAMKRDAGTGGRIRTYKVPKSRGKL